MRGAVLAHVGDLGLPRFKLVVKVLQVSERAPRHEVTLHILHAGLDLALGLRAVRPTHPRFESLVPRKRLEGWVPALLPLALPDHHGAHAIVENLPRNTREVLESVLVRRQQRLHALVFVALGPGTARIAERHHEDLYF